MVESANQAANQSTAHHLHSYSRLGVLGRTSLVVATTLKLVTQGVNDVVAHFKTDHIQAGMRPET